MVLRNGWHNGARSHRAAANTIYGGFASERRRRRLTGDLCFDGTLRFHPFLQRCAEASRLGAEV